MRVVRDTVLPLKAELSGPLVIAASGVTIEGNGTTVVGPGKAGELDSFQGVGIVAEGCSGVTHRNLRVRGFRVALAASDGAGWLVEDCDFSDNFTEPAAGWNVERRHGGIVFVGAPASHCVARGNHCHHNNGGGIVFRGDVACQGRAWRAFHWIIEGNRLEHNRWGIHAQHADLLQLAANAYQANEHPDFFDNVTRLETISEPTRAATPAILAAGKE
ncbi:MAG: hypothetical protein FJ290_32960 [Planctomycetes bacterium]|nr:hypothetical protein [Planctomycetota bacterium]